MESINCIIGIPLLSVDIMMIIIIMINVYEVSTKIDK